MGVLQNVLPVLKWVRGEPLSQDHWLDLFRLVGLPRGTTLEKLTFGDILSVADNIVLKAKDLKVRPFVLVFGVIKTVVCICIYSEMRCYEKITPMICRFHRNLRYQWTQPLKVRRMEQRLITSVMGGGQRL